MLAIWLGMAFTRTFRWREWSFLVIGALFVLAIYFSIGHLFSLDVRGITPLIPSINEGQWDESTATLIFWVLSAILLLWSVYWSIDIYQHSKMRRKNLLKASVAVAFIVSALVVYLQFQAIGSGCILLAIPVSVSYTYLFQGVQSKKAWLANLE